MVRIAFKDSTNTQDNKWNGGWAKCIGRRLFHCAVNICFSVANATNDTNSKVFWSESSFVKATARAMKHRRRSADDESPFIMWRTDHERGVRFDNLKAMLVDDNIHQRSSLPARKRKASDCFEFEKVKPPPGDTRDMFFSWLKPNKVTHQLNDVIFGRIHLAVYKHFSVETESRNSPHWKVQCKNIKTQRSMKLSQLWTSQTSFENNFREFNKKKMKTNNCPQDQCRLNEVQWGCPNSGGICLFAHPNETEGVMNELLSQNNHKEAILHACEGHMTENFLVWLLEMRVFYEKLMARDIQIRQAKQLFFAQARI
jgi:hypothetical protein